MSRWADWIVITPEEAEAFQEAATLGSEAVLELLRPLLEAGSVVQIDRAWEPIHRCLTGDRSPPGELDLQAGDYPLALCVLGGDPLLDDGVRSLTLVQSDEVPEVAEALSKIDPAWLRKQFFALPPGQSHALDEEAFAWMWGHFARLPPFFAQAAAQGKAVLCTIAH